MFIIDFFAMMNKMKNKTTTPAPELNSEGLPIEYYDIVDHNDKPLGYTADFDEARRRGLWRRGVHVIIYTEDGKIVMQKRTANLILYPGEIEVSVGGGVNAGETPAMAAVREVKEELGLDISGYKLNFIGRSRYNHQLKNNGTHRIIDYNFAVCVPEPALQFNPSPLETAKVFLLTRRQLRRAIAMHRVKHIGRMVPKYSTWRKLLDAVPAVRK